MLSTEEINKLLGHLEKSQAIKEYAFGVSIYILLFLGWVGGGYNVK